MKEQESSPAPKNATEILLIGGPTASGKSRLAGSLSGQIPCEIINADSRQIYLGLSIGTGRPQQEALDSVPHHLYGFLNPNADFTAADFESLAAKKIEEISGRTRLPVLVGGTGFYMKAVLRGMWPVSPRNDVLRERLRRIHQKHGHLHRMLQRLDPESAVAVPPADTYRIIRALEIYFETGTPRSRLPRNQQERYNALKFYLDPGRAEMDSLIRQRTNQMFERGWVEEVESLLRNYPDFEELSACQSLGYREVISYLKGKISLDDCKQQIVQKTRQYAKRQLTWFRNQDNFVRLTSCEDFSKMTDSVLQWYRK